MKEGSGRKLLLKQDPWPRLLAGLKEKRKDRLEHWQMDGQPDGQTGSSLVIFPRVLAQLVIIYLAVYLLLPCPLLGCQPWEGGDCVCSNVPGLA